MKLGVYAAAMDWRDGEADRLRALVNGDESALIGTSAVKTVTSSLGGVSGDSPELAP
jgi:hypothetical protein